MKPGPKKIIIVFNSLNIGGIETKIVDICSYYAKHPEIQVFLLLKNQEGLLLDSIPKNIKIISPEISTRWKLKTILFPVWLSVVFKKIKPDLIITFGNYSSICGVIGKFLSRLKSNLVISEDSSIIEELQSSTFPNLRRFLLKLTYPQSQKIIVLTPGSKQKLLTLVPHLALKIVIKKNWLPLSFTNLPSSKTNQKNIDILFLGRFESQKNPLRFLKIVRRIIKLNPKLKVVMIGYGSLQTDIKNCIKKHNLSSNITLKPSNTDKTVYLQNSKILLLTSDHEGFPLTILESLASNCIPVCRTLPEIATYFHHYPNLLLFEKRKAAVKQIQYLLKNPKIRIEVSHYYHDLVIQEQQRNFQATISLFDSHL